MKQIFSSYSHKLLTLTLLISIFPIIVFGSLFYLDKIDNEIDSIKHLLIMSSEDKSEHISDWLQERKINVEDISHNSIIISETKKLLDENSDEHELFQAKFSIEQQLNVAIQNHVWLKDLRIIDAENGDVLFFTGLSIPKYNLQYQNHFLEAAKGKTSFSDIYPSLEIIKNEYGSFEKGVPTLLISSPIQGEVGIEGILTARIDVFELEKLIDKHTFEDFVSIEHYLVNSNGYLLSKPNSFSELWNNNLFEKRTELEISFGDILSDDSLRSILDSGNNELGWNEGYENFLGERVVGISVPVDGTNWHFMTEINHNEAFYDTTFFQIILLSLIGVTLLSVSGVSLFFSTKLTSPIKNLIRVIEQIKKGNLKVNVKICGSDEIHDLATSFNSMAKTLLKSKETEQATLKKYQDLYEKSPVLNRTINREGVITNCNNAYADAFGYKKEEIIGKSVFDFVPEEHRNLLMESFTTWRDTGVVQSREIILKKKDGSTFPALLSANNLYDEKGKRVGSNTIIMDISSIRKAEKEIENLKEKRLSAIGELTARIAHDMRNPLSVIKNTADIIKMEYPDMDEKSIHNWQRLERGIDRIKHQVEDVLEYVKISPLKKQPSHILQIFQDALERVDIPENIHISLPHENPRILCDSEKLESVFVNLIMNAVQAIGKKQGKILISIEDDSLDFFKISFEDSGPGIPPNLVSKIFDPLFTTRQIGTGLGLPSCKNIIENHGGTIKALNSHDSGAILEIVLPKETKWDQSLLDRDT